MENVIQIIKSKYGVTIVWRQFSNALWEKQKQASLYL